MTFIMSWNIGVKVQLFIIVTCRFFVIYDFKFKDRLCMTQQLAANIWATRLLMQIQARGQIQCYPSTLLYLVSLLAGCWDITEVQISIQRSFNGRQTNAIPIGKSKKIVSAFGFLSRFNPNQRCEEKKNNDDNWLMNPARMK